MVNVLDPQWPVKGYSPLTAKEISQQIGPNGRVGEFLVEEYTRYLRDKKLVDRFGYPLLMNERELEGWRRYELNKLIRAIETIGSLYK